MRDTWKHMLYAFLLAKRDVVRHVDLFSTRWGRHYRYEYYRCTLYYHIVVCHQLGMYRTTENKCRYQILRSRTDCCVVRGCVHGVHSSIAIPNVIPSLLFRAHVPPYSYLFSVPNPNFRYHRKGRDDWPPAGMDTGHEQMPTIKTPVTPADASCGTLRAWLSSTPSPCRTAASPLLAEHSGKLRSVHHFADAGIGEPPCFGGGRGRDPLDGFRLLRQGLPGMYERCENVFFFYLL